VHDPSTKPPEVQHPGPHALGGRGLLLVERLSHGWGIGEDSAGKNVWFALRT
jgi:hypothetical protein